MVTVSNSTPVDTTAVGFWLSERYVGPTHCVGTGLRSDIVESAGGRDLDETNQSAGGNKRDRPAAGQRNTLGEES